MCWSGGCTLARQRMSRNRDNRVLRGEKERKKKKEEERKKKERR